MQAAKARKTGPEACSRKKRRQGIVSLNLRMRRFWCSLTVPTPIAMMQGGCTHGRNEAGPLPKRTKTSSPMQGRKDRTLPCRLPVSLRLSDEQTCGHTRDHKGRQTGRQRKRSTDRQPDYSRTASVQQARLRDNATTYDPSGRSLGPPKPSHDTRQGHVAPTSRRSKNAKGKPATIAQDASPSSAVRRGRGRVVG